MPHALVTGALGGVGVALRRVLESKGYTVIGIDRGEGDPGEAGHVALDLRRLAGGASLPEIESIRPGLNGRLDLLVNNAAHQVVRPLEELTAEDWDATLQTNLLAPFWLTRAFLPELEAASGSVVNIASIHARATKPGFVAYATSKGALVTMTQAMAVELGPRGVRVNAILPAAIDTPMLRAGFEGDPEGFADLAAAHPAGRIAAPEEVAAVAAFLGSNEAPFVTGSTIEIDGGIGARLHDPA